MGCGMTNVNVGQPPWIRRFGIFWRLIILILFGSGIIDALQADQALFSSWRGAAMLLLIGAYLVVYELFERSDIRRSGHWPTPYRTVLLYLIVQLAIMSVLNRFFPGFSGPIFALMGQVVSALPMRRWPLPLLAMFALAGATIGLFEDIAAQNW